MFGGGIGSLFGQHPRSYGALTVFEGETGSERHAAGGYYDFLFNTLPVRMPVEILLITAGIVLIMAYSVP
ncbi:MAG: hypothetical protein NTZ78_04680 [Candidatus Aureabacteria bacterium]|nr:hypothetical protein [Candidatus Auribacterota bacterium]